MSPNEDSITLTFKSNPNSTIMTDFVLDKGHQTVTRAELS